MFGLFKKREESTKVKDKIWMNTEAKLQAVLNECKKTPDAIFIFWFDESLKQAESYFTNQGSSTAPLVTARETNSIHATGKKIILGEHYPLLEKENDFFQKLKLAEVEIWSALDEPLFKHFGSDKIIQMMKQLGMNETDVIENSMVSSAIRKAQEKISKQHTLDHTSYSQKDWLGSFNS
jgi:hypothetical protein